MLKAGIGSAQPTSHHPGLGCGKSGGYYWPNLHLHPSPVYLAGDDNPDQSKEDFVVIGQVLDGVLIDETDELKQRRVWKFGSMTNSSTCSL